MKQIFKISACVIVLLASCARENIPQLNYDGYRLSIKVAEDATKTYFQEDEGRLLSMWNADDQLSVWAENENPAALISTFGTLANILPSGRTAQFEGSATSFISSPRGTLRAFYPAGILSKAYGYEVAFTYETKQYPEASSFDFTADRLISNSREYSADEGGNIEVTDISFKRIVAPVRINLSSNDIEEGVKSIAVTSKDLFSSAVVDTHNLGVYKNGNNNTATTFNIYPKNVIIGTGGTNFILAFLPCTKLKAGNQIKFEIECFSSSISKTITLEEDILLQPDILTTLNVQLDENNITSQKYDNLKSISFTYRLENSDNSLYFREHAGGIRILGENEYPIDIDFSAFVTTSLDNFTGTYTVSFPECETENDVFNKTKIKTHTHGANKVTTEDLEYGMTIRTESLGYGISNSLFSLSINTSYQSLSTANGNKLPCISSLYPSLGNAVLEKDEARSSSTMVYYNVTQPITATYTSPFNSKNYGPEIVANLSYTLIWDKSAL